MAVIHMLNNNPAEDIELEAAVPMAEGNDDEDSRLYELGFHLVPMVGDEGAPTEAAKVRKVVEEKGATIVGEEAPRLMRLGYPMRAHINRTHHVCESAYFGWV